MTESCGFWATSEIDFAASLVAREPVTKSEHKQLLAEHENDFIPGEPTAVVLAEEQRAWSNDDLEEVGWARELVVKPDSWQRLQKEAEQEAASGCHSRRA